MVKAVSLFSGCGGSDLGLTLAGFNVVMANDILPYARAVYEANLPEADFKLCNVSEIKIFPSADLLVGCYPCQGFSQGGVRDPSRKINYLYREFDRALRQIKPKAFIVENVSGMARANFQHLLNNQLIRYRFAGYRVSWKILNAKDYGLAQERKRIFIVGIRMDLGKKYDFPEPSHGSDCSKPYLTQRDVIGDMPNWPEGEFCNHDFHWYYLSRDRYRGWEEQSKTIVSNYRHIPLHPSSPALIKHAHNDWRFENNNCARRLSFKEAARLQGFPIDIVFPDGVPLVKKYEVVGNAVPPPLFKSIACNLPDIW